MKKVTILLLTFTSMFAFNTRALNNSHQLIFDDLNTLNFKEKINDDIKFENIKKICSYDYCDYLGSDSIEASLEIFTNNYLKTINSEDERNMVKVKGIKITKIVLQN